MATTTLRLPDGTSVTLEHDDQVTKEELLKYAEQELVTPEMSAKPIQKKEPSIGTDLKRVFYRDNEGPYKKLSDDRWIEILKYIMN